jgi:hypothetical protein
VAVSFDQPIAAGKITALGALNLLGFGLEMMSQAVAMRQGEARAEGLLKEARAANEGSEGSRSPKSSPKRK